MKPQGPAPNSSATVCGSEEEMKIICIVGGQKEVGGQPGKDESFPQCWRRKRREGIKGPGPGPCSGSPLGLYLFIKR